MDIKTTLLNWLETSGRPIVWSHQASPRPNIAYGTINPHLSSSRSGRAEQRQTDTPGEVETIQHRKRTISCNLYGGDAFEDLEAAQLRLSSPTIQDLFRSAGISLLDAGTVRDLTGLAETKWESRAQLDIVIGLADSITDTPGWIEHLEYNSSLTVGISPVEITGTI